MKQALLFASLSLSLITHAQKVVQMAPIGPLDRGSTRLGTTSGEMIHERGTMNLENVTTKVDGETVQGTPFLYSEWYPGTVATANGKNVEGYMLKYDALNQKLLFARGEEMMEVTDVIKQFTLVAPNNENKMERFTFIHSDQFKKLREPLYYESMCVTEKGYLLKTNQKKIVRRDMNLAVNSEKKTFILETDYFYFDKETRKLTRVKPDGSNLAIILLLPPEKQAEISNFDLTSESGMIKAFMYFQKPVKQF